MELRTQKKENKYEVYLHGTHSHYSVKWKIRQNARVSSGQLLGFVESHGVLPSSECHAEEAFPVAMALEDPSASLPVDSLAPFSTPPMTASCSIISPTSGRFSRFLDDSSSCFEELQRSFFSNTSCNSGSSKGFFLFQVIEEPCSHSILVEGLCSECGQTIQSITEGSKLESTTCSSGHTCSSSSSSSSSWSCVSTSYTRKLGFVSPSTSILVSSKTAKALEFEKVKSLLLAKKLPLILDLDNTLLHAYPFPPPSDVSELLHDCEFRVVKLDDPLLYLPYKPVNHEANHSSHHDTQHCIPPHYDTTFPEEERKKVEQRWESWVISVISYDLSIPSTSPPHTPNVPVSDHIPRSYPCYFKLRPGVLEFLREASKKFELYLFTAGAPVHAASSLRVLDPERRWFGSRVFTREDLPFLDSGALGLKTIQRIFPGEASTQNLVTVVDDCESVWSPDSNLFKVHAYHWWPDPSLHPFLLLYCRRTPTGAGSHSEIPVKIVDPNAFSRIRAAAFSMLNFCPSIIEMCKSPRRVYCKDFDYLPFPPTSLDGGFSSHDEIRQESNPIESINDDEDSLLVVSGLDNALALAEKGIEDSETEALELDQGEYITSSDTLMYQEDTSKDLDQDGDEQEKISRELMPGKRFEQNRNPQVSMRKKVCSAWQHKGFERRKKGETQEEMNARVLKVTTKNWRAPNIVKDTDRQLNHLLSILGDMHETFFFQAGEIDFETVNIDKLPSVKNILDSMRQRVLQNVTLQATGIREASIPDFHDTDLGRSVISLGGKLVAHPHSQPVTHLLVGKETKFYVDAIKNELFPHSAHLMWLEAALFTFQRYDEALFTVDRCEKHYRVFWDALEGDVVPTRTSHSSASSSPEKQKANDNNDSSTSASCVEDNTTGTALDSLIPIKDKSGSEADHVDLDTLQRELLESLD